MDAEIKAICDTVHDRLGPRSQGDAEIERTLEAVSNSLTEVRAQGLI